MAAGNLSGLGRTAGGSVFDLPEFKMYEGRFYQRMVKFGRFRRYYEGTIYEDSAFKLAHKLYAQTRSLFSFLARAVDLDQALVPGIDGAWELTEETPRAIRNAQAQLYEWSGWPTEGDDWLEDGATLGEAMLKIVPDLEAGTVLLQRLKPEMALHAPEHAREGMPAPLLLIIDRSNTGADGRQYEYAEAITPDEIRTFYDGEPFGFEGNPPSYPNRLGMLPLVTTQNDGASRPTFSKAQRQIDSVNEMASYLGDIIGRHAEPQWAASGVEQSELTRGDNVWFLPTGANIDAILAEIDIEGTLNFVRELKVETKANLPELAFDDLRAKDQIATETLHVQLLELRAKVWKMRRHYDNGLIQAHRVAAAVGIAYGIGGLETLLAPHSMDYRRQVLPQSELERIRLREAELSLELLESSVSGESMTAAMQAQDGQASRAQTIETEASSGA